MRYWMVICFRQLKWDLIHNWFLNHSSFFHPFIVQWRILRHKDKYKTFWQQQICQVYRDWHNEGLAFNKSFEGLPKWTDKIK